MRYLLTTVFLAFACTSTLIAENNAKGPAFTEPPKGDKDFALMGEFLGEITPVDGEKETLGLQLRSLGDGSFDAQSFLGGLPGQDKHKPEAFRMIGQRSDDFVVLSGGPWVMIVEKDHCLLVDRKGNKIGKLNRLQRSSPSMGALPPEDAIVLFDGKNVDQFSNAQMTKDGLLMQGADLKPMFQDFNLHVEFRIPYMPKAEGQSRGNSGLYLQSRYECQVLDSFGLDRLQNGLGSLYRFKKPDVNMALPPLSWQTYDVQFTAPRWAADGSKVRNARITSWINGVKVQDNVELPNKTGAGQQEEPILLPTKFQDHGDPVRFRNVWLVDRGLATGNFPVYPTKEELEAAKNAKIAAAKKEAAKKAAADKKAASEKAAADKKADAEKADAEKATAEKKPEAAAVKN
ncbi:MAG: hypothetical protein CMM05_06055 [Rhodopirellula sp.]|nr:hypothetical protein [Rhodopirellula sp.]